ncbi:MAG: hypothetical protein OXG51_01115 [Gammaproteobacteria bacterium]|nr:hypothetical protein [Gammaproteobacteria bacterium]
MDMLSKHEQRNGKAWPAPSPNPAAKPFSRVLGDADGYPYVDGEPMAQTTRHCNEIFYAASALKTQYAGNPDTFVALDLLMHYRRGDRRERESRQAAERRVAELEAALGREPGLSD